MTEEKSVKIEGLEERLRSIFQVAQQDQLADIFGEPHGRFNHYLTGRTRLPVHLLIEIYQSAKRLTGRRINLAWLLTNEGPENIEEDKGGDVIEDASLAEILRQYQRLDPKTKEHYRPTLEMLSREFKIRNHNQDVQPYPHAASPGIQNTKPSRKTERDKRKDVTTGHLTVIEDEEREDQE